MLNRPFGRWTVRLVFGAALVFTLVMALLPRPPSLFLDRYGDKAEHMLAFATLAVLARLAFREAPSRVILERLSFVGALIEVFQAIPALHRDCDWTDWAADTFAAGVALLIAEAARRRTLQLRARNASAQAAHG